MAAGAAGIDLRRAVRSSCALAGRARCVAHEPVAQHIGLARARQARSAAMLGGEPTAAGPAAATSTSRACGLRRVAGAERAKVSRNCGNACVQRRHQLVRGCGCGCSARRHCSGRRSTACALASSQARSSARRTARAAGDDKLSAVALPAPRHAARPARPAPRDERDQHGLDLVVGVLRERHVAAGPAPSRASAASVA